jgi:hypothetical protein
MWSNTVMVSLIRAAADKQHYNKTYNPEDSLERELHHAKADVE